MASGGGDSGGGGSTSTTQSLLVVVLDICPYVWGERELKRTAGDKARFAQKKSSLGPVTLIEEVLPAIQAFACSFCSLDRNSVIIVVGVANNETAVIYPRKDNLARFFANPETYPACDLRRLQQDLVQGVAELIKKAANKAAASNAATMTNNNNNNNSSEAAANAAKDPAAVAAEEARKIRQITKGASSAMAAGFSMALCCINRFLVATQTGIGVSALSSEHFLNRADDGGVLAIMGGGIDKGGSKKQRNMGGTWSPRILLIQACEDRSSDYNAFMNCAFAAVKHNVVVDGFVIPERTGSSPFLEQACDLTGGVYLAPSGPMLIAGALTQVLLSVFLASRPCRTFLNLPTINKVDFRARCFETGKSVDRAFVCNQCLSIFEHKPKDRCPTCQANIKSEKRRKDTIN